MTREQIAAHRAWTPAVLALSARKSGEVLVGLSCTHSSVADWHEELPVLSPPNVPDRDVVENAHEGGGTA